MRRLPAHATGMLAAVVMAAVAVACTSAGPGGGTSTSPTRHVVTSTPRRVDATRFHTTTPIKHVVFIIKENRSFDNLFGLFPGANGATVGSDCQCIVGHGTQSGAGTVRPLTVGFGQRLPHDLPHDFLAALKAYDGGKMDGFNQSAASDLYAYTQLHGPDQLPNYWHWAQRYVLADDFFASVNGPSFPNHLFTIAAQSGGTHSNPDEGPLAQRAPFKTWGCDATATETVDRDRGPIDEPVLDFEDTEGHLVKVPPCFDFRTVGDLLSAKGIPWSYYAAPPAPRDDAPVTGYIWSAYSAIRHIRERPKVWRRHVFPVQQVVHDIDQGRLPPVTWITPQFAFSEHPEYNFCYGENWTTRVVDSIMRSPMWKSTAIFITWDDWGGFYDHVPPPQIDRFGLGIRVPLLLISPYAKRGRVDHEHGEFSSVLRFIEDNWGLPQLTTRDREASDLSYDFDFGAEPGPPDPLPPRTDCEGVALSPPPPDAYR
jgi:phospholipase C